MLASLKLSFWRSHHSTELVLRRVNFLRGRPGSGKSSIPDAIVTLLLGKNRYTDACGVGIKDDITVGKPAAIITGDFAGLKVTREVSQKASQRLTYPDAPTNVDAAKETLLRSLGANEEAVMALLNPKNILECDEAEQQKILIRLMRPPTIEVPEAASAVGIDAINSTQDIDAHIKRIKEVTIRDLNREVSALEEAIRNAPVEVPDVSAIRKELESVQVLHEKNLLARMQKSRYLQDAEKAKSKVERLKTDDATAYRPMTEILSNLDTLAESLRENAKLLAEVRESKGKAQKECGDAISAAAATASQAEAVTGMGSKCGVVGEIECPLTTRDKARTKVVLSDRAAKEKEKALELQRGLASIIEREKELVAEGQDIEGQQDEIEKEKRQAKAAQERQADLAAAQAELDEIQANPVEGVDDGAIQASQERGSSLQAQIAQSDQARASVAKRSLNVASCDVKRQATEMQAAAVAALVALKAEILKKGGDVFMAKMKLILDRFGLTGVEFVAQPYSLRVSGVGARRLSSGQKLIFDAALRVAAAKATGFKMFAIDDSNRLDDPSRGKIQKMLGESGCQVFVCQTIDKPPAPEAVAKLPADCAVFWMESNCITGPTIVNISN